MSIIQKEQCSCVSLSLFVSLSPWPLTLYLKEEEGGERGGGRRRGRRRKAPAGVVQSPSEVLVAKNNDKYI